MSLRPARERLDPEERQRRLVDGGTRVFARHGYRAATSGQLAVEAGVSQGLIYHHFGTKRDLYLRCVDEAWGVMRTMWEARIADDPDPTGWLRSMGAALIAPDPPVEAASRLWLRSMTDAAEDDVVREHMAAQLREVHAFVASVFTRSQQQGGVRPALDPDAEAWIFVATGLLVMVDRQLDPELLSGIAGVLESRRGWLYGE